MRWRGFPSGLTCLSVSPCRGPVSPHTSMETRLMSQLELRDSCHTTAAYKNSVPNKQTNKRWTALNKTHIHSICHRGQRRRGEEEEEEDEEKKKLCLEKERKKKLIWNIRKKKMTTSILCLHRVFWCSICQVLLKRHMQIWWCTLKMTDCVTKVLEDTV